MRVVLLLALSLNAFFTCSGPAEGFNIHTKDATEPSEALLQLQQAFPFAIEINDTESPAYILLTPLAEYWEQEDGMGNHSGDCQRSWTRLSELAGNLTHCLLVHSQPFRACGKCVEQYTRYTNSFKEFMANDACRTMMSMADRMLFFTAVYNTFTSAWASAACNSCFSYIEENSTTGEVTFNYTKEVQVVQELGMEVSSCFKNYSNDINPVNNISEVCYMCKPVYTQMKKNFSVLKRTKKGQICMDLLDEMNSTWLMWNSEYKCPHPRADATPVIVFSSIVGAATVVLYVGSKAVVKIRIPHILKAKRIKTCRSRRRLYKGVCESNQSFLNEDDGPSLAAAAHVQGVDSSVDTEQSYQSY